MRLRIHHFPPSAAISAGPQLVKRCRVGLGEDEAADLAHDNNIALVNNIFLRSLWTLHALTAVSNALRQIARESSRSVFSRARLKRCRSVLADSGLIIIPSRCLNIY